MRTWPRCVLLRPVLPRCVTALTLARRRSKGCSCTRLATAARSHRQHRISWQQDVLQGLHAQLVQRWQRRYRPVAEALSVCLQSLTRQGHRECRRRSMLSCSAADVQSMSCITSHCSPCCATCGIPAQPHCFAGAPVHSYQTASTDTAACVPAAYLPGLRSLGREACRDPGCLPSCWCAAVGSRRAGCCTRCRPARAIVQSASWAGLLAGRRPSVTALHASCCLQQLPAM